MAGGAQQSGEDSLWSWGAHSTPAMTGQGRRMDGSQGWKMDAPEMPAQMLPIGNGVANGIYARVSAWGAWRIRPRRWRCVSPYDGQADRCALAGRLVTQERGDLRVRRKLRQILRPGQLRPLARGGDPAGEDPRRGLRGACTE